MKDWDFQSFVFLCFLLYPLAMQTATTVISCRGCFEINVPL